MTAVMQDAPSVIPAKAGIQKREQFFVTLHNASWVRDYHVPFPDELPGVRAAGPAYNGGDSGID